MRLTLRFGAVLSLAVMAFSLAPPPRAFAQAVDGRLGVDSRVNYKAMVQLGPWDDRNYKVTQEDLKLLAPNESELRDPIPVFFRIELRKSNPGMLREGNAQYPRSALQIFKMRYGGYLVNGKLYRETRLQNGLFQVIEKDGVAQEEFARKALSSDVRVTSPTGGAESAVKIHPTDTNKVIAGSNGPGSGQIMWYSTNGGSSWTQSAALPQGSTCCDPTVDWSSNGQFAYTSTLGGCTSVCNVWAYRSSDGGATWNDLATITPGDGRREITSANTSDKQYLHVDKFATSPRKDNLYHCWHDNNTLKFSRSTDFANTWSAPLTMSSGTAQAGIGCDLTSDKNGNVFYFWPATNGKTILMRKSTDGGATFAAAVTVATTQDGYDFAIPAMETRRAFIYASADADLSGGAFANSIYAAWTDTTAAENTTTPSSNHGRIQVAFSRDGGATWSVRTPHSTANQTTVDRFHPWVGVGPDGKVYVMFYDTTRDAARVAVDVYYSVSSDGGNTWAAPTRVTSVISPQVDDSFEWGDYNGLDVVGNQLIAIFTDNRNEGGGSADSIDVYAAGAQVGTVTPVCGNNVIEGTEVCDGSNLNGQTCVSQGFLGGTLSCNASCTAFVTSSCTNTCTPPAVPAGVAATAASSTQINVSWTASAGATSYNVQRSTTSGGPYASVGTPAASPFSNTGLTCNTTYFYVVSASNGTCGSANSTQVQATTSACTCNAISDVEPNNSRTAPQAISGTCNQISGTFLNDATTQQNDYFRLSLPAGRTVTALLNGLTVDYDVYIYNSTTGSAVASSTLGGTSADTASWTNTGASAVTVYVRAYRFSSTRTTYQLRISY